MPILDFSHLTPEQRLTLIGELWDSLEADNAALLTQAQAKEIERRLATMDEDIKHGIDAEESLALLRQRLG